MSSQHNPSSAIFARATTAVGDVTCQRHDRHVSYRGFGLLISQVRMISDLRCDPKCYENELTPHPLGQCFDMFWKESKFQVICLFCLRAVCDARARSVRSWHDSHPSTVGDNDTAIGISTRPRAEP